MSPMSFPPTLVGPDMIGTTSACARTTDVLAGVGQEQLDNSTPCEKLSPRDLVAGGPVEGLFAPMVEIGSEATAFDRALALSGRDPGWRR
jgi:hypothetical protein